MDQRIIRPGKGRSMRTTGPGVVVWLTLLAGAVWAADTPNPRHTPVVQAVQKTRASVVALLGGESGGSDRSYEIIGAGVVVDKRGYLVTNAHLIRTGRRIRIQLADGTEWPAEVVAKEAAADLAILRVRTAKPLLPLPLGTASDLLVGETVIAVGHPYGYSHTISRGIISGLDRKIKMRAGETLSHLIQTDANINPGNSGGPLLNINGEWIGINSAVRQGAQGIAFAINVETVKQALCQHLSAGKIAGICHSLICTERVRPEGADRQRVMVSGVGEQTAAARAGVEAGDEVRAVGGRAVANCFDIERAFWDYKPGDRVRITVVRQEKEKTLTLTLAAIDRSGTAPLAQSIPAPAEARD